MPCDRIKITSTLKARRDDEFLYSRGEGWGFCAQELRKLWHFPRTAACWLELTRTRKPGSWKIRFRLDRIAVFLDPGCPITGKEELLYRTQIIGLVRRLVPRGKHESRELYVRLLYRDDGDQ